MSSAIIHATVDLSPEDNQVLTAMSREEHLPESALLTKLVREGLARRRLVWACAAYARGDLNLMQAARYADLNVYELLDELKRRDIAISTPEQFLDGLSDLAELFALPELRVAAEQARA